MEARASAARPVTWATGTAWRRPARPRLPAGRAARARAPTGRAHAQGGAPPLPRGEGVYGEAAAAAAEAEAEAAAMAPFPEEVDVFTAPHWRMKQLVGLYCDKVTACGASCSGQRRRRGERAGSLAAWPAPRPQPPGPRRANCRLRSCQRGARCPASSRGARSPPGWRLRCALGARGAALARLRPPGRGPGRPPPSGPAPRGRAGPPAPASFGRGPPPLPTDLGDPGSATCGGFPSAWGRPFLRLSPASHHHRPRPVWGLPESLQTPSILLNLWLNAWPIGPLLPTTPGSFRAPAFHCFDLEENPGYSAWELENSHSSFVVLSFFATLIVPSIYSM